MGKIIVMQNTVNYLAKTNPGLLNTLKLKEQKKSNNENYYVLH